MPDHICLGNHWYLAEPQSSVLSDEQIEDIQATCAEGRSKLENASHEQNRQIIDPQDVRGTLAIENEEKVVTEDVF